MIPKEYDSKRLQAARLKSVQKNAKIKAKQEQRRIDGVSWGMGPDADPDDDEEEAAAAAKKKQVSTRGDFNLTADMMGKGSQKLFERLEKHRTKKRNLQIECERIRAKVGR